MASFHPQPLAFAGSIRILPHRLFDPLRCADGTLFVAAHDGANKARCGRGGVETDQEITGIPSPFVSQLKLEFGFTMFYPSFIHQVVPTNLVPNERCFLFNECVSYEMLCELFDTYICISYFWFQMKTKERIILMFCFFIWLAMKVKTESKVLLVVFSDVFFYLV